MQKLVRADLYSLETYHEQRADMRRKVMAHKAKRKVQLGAHAALYFEDRLTIQYQVQEMLRVERIYAREAIQEELDAYNPLIPDGDNLKATFMLEYDDVDERRAALARLRGVERQVWLAVGEHARVYAIADEDLERDDESKTAAVHFLRFQLSVPMCVALKGGAPLAFGIEHDHYSACIDPVSAETRAALAADVD